MHLVGLEGTDDMRENGKLQMSPSLLSLKTGERRYH